MAHAEMFAPPGACWLNGDDFRRLETFHWEWQADQAPALYREWVREMGKPISQLIGVNTDGLVEAATGAASVVQRELHERSPPLTHSEVNPLWYWRRIYLRALIHLGGNRLAKRVEAEVAPNGQPLAICIGSTDLREIVTTVKGGMRFYGYEGCRRTFPDASYGPGRRWPRLCPTCEPRRTNSKQKAIRELLRRAEGFH